MSREIKFRIWNNTKKEMCLLDWLDENGNVYRDEGYDAPNYMNKETYELMQYTGIKDKNGVEVFEGDILQNLRGKKFQVIWSESELAWCDIYMYSNSREGNGMLADLRDVATIEVIGNVYENPDLIKR